MKRFEIILIQIFAIISSYLIFSMPFAFGFQISIFDSVMQEFQTSVPDFTDLVEKSFSYPYRQNLQYIRITLSGRDPGNTIKKVYLYRCKDYDPVSCLQNGVMPVISVSPFNTTLWFNDETRWNDVQRNDVANFLTLVKMDIGGREVWTGSWDTIEKTGVKQFTEKNHDLDKLNVYLKSGIQGTNAKSHVETNMNIPMEWVDHSVFTLVEGSSVGRLYELTGSNNEVDPSGTGTPEFQVGTLTGNSFNGSTKDWAFVFGGNGKVSNPVAFYGKGGAGPVTPPTSQVKLKIDNWAPQTVTCGSSEVINITAHVENVSALNCGEADCYFQDYYYTVDGTQSSPGSITCSISDPSTSIYKYECSIPVDSLPACNAPKTSTFALYFTYKNNVVLSAEFPVTLQKAPAKLMVTSLLPSIFDCGIDTEMTANLRVTNPPSGSPAKYYTFDGVNFNTMSCTGSGTNYICKIPENEICSLLQEDLDVSFKFEYAEEDITSDPMNIHVTFPPPSMGIDTVTPEVLTAGETTTVNVLLHVNYPDSITYSDTDFKYKYLDNSFQSVTCSLDNSFTNIKYHKCSFDLNIPSGREGVEELTMRLDAYQGGQLKSLSAKYFLTIQSPPPQPSLTIVSTSSPLDCVSDSSLTVQAKSENIAGTPGTSYSVDGGSSFHDLTCSGSGDVYTCYIPKEDLCSLMTNSLELILKFSYDGTDIVSNAQKVYVKLPEPHMQVYSVYPDTLGIGKTTTTTVNLYIQYPETLGSSPSFTYSYLDKADQSMSCQKVSSTSIRNYYRCSQTGFDIPADYSGNKISVTFAVEGTTLTYPYTLSTAAAAVSEEPWLEVQSTIPGKIEVEAGNKTEATLMITVHRAAENNLKNDATLQPTKWITSGTCQQTAIDYDFSCDVTVSASKDASFGENSAEVKVRVSDGKTYTLSNYTKVYVLPGKYQIEIQSITPDKLYCTGHKQQNPSQIKVNAKLMNLQADSMLQEKLVFNGDELVHTDRYCTFQSGSITCNIPTDKLLEKVSCGSGDLAPGEGLHYYPFSLTFLLKKGDEQLTVSGAKDLGVEAIPLQAYLEIVDTDIQQGFLTEPVNCLGSKTIRLGEGGNYVRIRYADLLHQTPDEGDLTWSFRMDAYDQSGKLTKGMGTSPTANATICRLKRHQQVGVHRYEDYDCTLFVDRQMFQRCENGEGTITLTALSKTMGRSADGEFSIQVSRGESDFNLYIQVEKDASNEITCWVTNFDGKCHLEYSQLNSTIAIKNRAKGDIGDLTLFDSDIKLIGGDVDTDVYSPYCRESAKGSHRFLCGFGIKPVITIKETVDNTTNQTFSDVDLGELELSTAVKYADGLAEDTLKAKIGTITVKPKKDPAFINYLEQKKEIRGIVKTVNKLIKWMMGVAGFCVTCAAGTWVYNKVAGEDENEGGGGGSNGNGNGGGGTSGGTGGGNGGTSQRGLTCIGSSSGKTGKCEYSSLCQGTSEPAKYNMCGEVSGLQCCIPESLFSGGGYEPEVSKAGFDISTLQKCIDCVKDTGKKWCVTSAKCIEESCDYSVGTEAGCKLIYPEGEATAEATDPVNEVLTATQLPDARNLNLPQIPKFMDSTFDNAKKADSWWKGVAAVFGIMAVIYLLLEIFDRKVFGTGDLMKAFTNGLKIGFICVVLQMLGDTLIGKTHDKSISDYAGKGMKYAGDLMYDICDFIAKNFPAIIALLNIVMRLMYVQKCIEDIDRSLDRQYYSSSYGSFQSGLAGTQSSMAKLQGCLSQFNQIMNSAYMVGQSMYYSGAAIWGTTSFKLYKSSGTEITRGKATICKGESLKYKVKNWCKVIREKGTDAQYIRITSSTKNNCAPVTIYSAETCRGYYGYGYGMGYTGTGMWPGGWAGGYTPMHQYAGTTEGQFIPTEVCGDDKNKENTYHLSIPGTGQYYEITYNPKC